MSGPKVVRVVTREELLAGCERELRRLEHELAHWQTHAVALGGLEPDVRGASAERVAQLRALLAQDRFADVLQAAQTEREFLRQDLAARETRAVQRATQARAAARRSDENRRMLLGLLDAEGSSEARRLAQGLRQADAQMLQAAMAECAAWLSRVEVTPVADLSAGQNALAQALQSGESQQAFAAWKAAQTQGWQDPRLQRLDQGIAELQILAGAQIAAPFVQRLAALQACADQPQKRTLLLDSLLLDVAEVSRNDAEFRAQRQTLLPLLEEAVLLEPAAAVELRQATQACEHARDSACARQVVARCRQIVAEAEQAQTAKARRQAVLNALAALGYEVREGMQTAWAEEGRIALRKHAMPDYGMEVAGAAGNERMQVRAVAFDEERDAQRDLDAETLWCGDIERLQEQLRKAGTELRIERALAVGQVAIKHARESSEKASNRDRDRGKPRERMR